MKPTLPFLQALILSSLLAACATREDTSLQGNTCMLVVRETTLTKAKPHEKSFKLVSISADNSVTIYLKKEHKKMTAKAGDSYPCETFGRIGLRLESADYKNQKASFSVTGAM